MLSWIDKAGFFSGINDDDDFEDSDEDSSDLRFNNEVELVCDVVLPELAWSRDFESPSLPLCPK